METPRQVEVKGFLGSPSADGRILINRGPNSKATVPVVIFNPRLPRSNTMVVGCPEFLSQFLVNEHLTLLLRDQTDSMIKF